MRMDMIALGMIICAIVFRICLEKFFNSTAKKARMAYIGGMIGMYTAIMILLILLTENLYGNQISVKEFAVLISIFIFCINLLISIIVTAYYFSLKKRYLNGREKIMLKDL